MEKYGSLDFDLYTILGLLSEDVTDKEVVKAYRKRALECHPDKNPGNSAAAEKFLKISKALEILTDISAKAAYDRLRKAKKIAAERHAKLDSNRKRFKETLEARETRAKEDDEMSRQKSSAKTGRDSPREDLATAEEILAREIMRLRKEGSDLLRREKAEIEREIKEESQRARNGSAVQHEKDPARLKVTWKAAKTDLNNGGYSADILRSMFEKYGILSALVVSAKGRGSAIVEFADVLCADLAQKCELGNSDNPLTISWLSGKPSARPASPLRTSHAPPSSFTSSGQRFHGDDFERSVLDEMRAAEQRRLAAEKAKSAMAESDSQAV